MRRNPVPKNRRYQVPQGTPGAITLEWRRFASFDSAWEAMPDVSCLYALQTTDRESMYVGQAGCLRDRYSSVRGILSAFMSRRGMLLFVAPVAEELVDLVEHTIIFWDVTPHNRQLVYSRPSPHIAIRHRLVGVEETPGGRYEGPGFCRPGELRAWESGVFK